MQTESQFRKPSSPLKPKHHKYITSQQCEPICCIRQEVSSLHSLQQTYLLPLIHTTQNFKWSRFTLTTLNISQLHILYIPPRDSTSTNYKTADTDIQHCIQYITNIPHSILTRDVNAHPTLWHSYNDDHRGHLITDVISNSDHITLNTNTPTKVTNTPTKVTNTPTKVTNTTLQQTSSPDITTVSNTLYNRTSWTTHHAL